MTLDKAKEKLIKELQLNPNIHDLGEGMINFILEDRKRIVEPLIIVRSYKAPQMTVNGQLNALWEASDKTLKNAGIE